MRVNAAIGILFLSLLVGCASTQKKDNAYVNKKYVKPTKSVVSERVDLKNIDCPRNSSSYIRMNWKQLLNVANSCVVKKKWNRLEGIANHLSTKEPHSPWGAYYLSLSAHAKKQYERSVWMADLAIKKSPNTAMFHYQKARVYWDLKEYSLSVDVLKKVVEIDDNFDEAHTFIGSIYLRDQKFKDALLHFKKAIEVNEKNKSALIGAAESSLSVDNLSESLKYFELVVLHFPRDLKVRMRQAYLYEYYDKNPKAALLKYKKIKELKGRKFFTGNVDIDLRTKIKSLEAIVGESAKKMTKRQPADQGEG